MSIQIWEWYKSNVYMVMFLEYYILFIALQHIGGKFKNSKNALNELRPIVEN